MRNDVKLGFAIGGVLLAVLIVYVLVVPGGSNSTKQAKVDNTSKKNTDNGKVTIEPVGPATQASAPPAAPGAEFTPGASGHAATQGIAGSEVASAEGENDNAAKVVDPTPPANAKDFNWNKFLNTTPMIAETPVPASESRVAQGGEGKTIAQPPVKESKQPAEPSNSGYQEIVRTPGGGVAIYPPPEAIEPKGEPKISHEPQHSSSTRASGAASGHTHRVAQYETLSSIAGTAYGNQNLWPAIVKANPGLDPNRMKAGQVINLPDISDAKPTGASSTGAQTASAKVSAAPIDSTKQYRVQSNDSLYKISVRLYGKGTMADKIYEANKAKIGEDPAKLKVNQVLDLPEPPTVTPAR